MPGGIDERRSSPVGPQRQNRDFPLRNAIEFMGSGKARRASRISNLLAAGAIVASTWAIAGNASAQQMPTVSQRGDNGVRVGSGRIHPFVGFQTRYDSYVGLSERAQQLGGTQEGTGDLILHVKPGLRLEVPSDSVELRAGVLVDYHAYTGMDEAWTSDLSRTAAALDINALINPKGNVQVSLDERFTRSDRITNMELGALTLSDRNDAGIHVAITPGGGSLLLRPGYVNTYEHFEPRSGESDPAVTRNDYWQHTAMLTVGYKLQEESALVLDSSLAIRNYERSASQQFDSQNLRVTAGFVGMIAPRVSFLAKAGYGKQLDVEGYDGILGQVELGYLYSEQTEVRAGYARTFEPSPSAGLFYSDDRVYLDGRTRLGSQLTLNAGLSYDQITFGETSGRGTEDQYGFHIGPDWEFNSVFTAGISYALTKRTSSRAVAGLEYDRHEVGAHVLVYY